MNATSSHQEREPIAIVGMGCRFPGSVDGPARFWDLLRNGDEAIREIPANRFDLDDYYDEAPKTPGKIMSRWGGYLDNIDRFDSYFFGIAPFEADRLDPQQRLLLETGWEALADAGQPAAELEGSDTGVFVGMWIQDFESRLFKNTDLVDFYMTTGSGRYAASGRLSYFLGLQGPSISVDTACSSSLVAVHLACQSLHQGECRQALAGGANVILQPHITIAYSQSGMMAPDGHCKFGDHRGDGYVRSEGAGLIVLKRLSDAVADGDRIYAVIRGSAINNDGRSGDFMATPSQAGQMDMLDRAYRNAGIAPHEVDYIEAHGTGTRAGDPVEVGAIGEICSPGRPADRPLYLGSVKTNLGHTEGAAGIAGLMKTALSIHHRQIPASLHVEELNPDIDWAGQRLDIATAHMPWPRPGSAVAGISAFGITGTNAHVVLSNAPESTDAAEAEASMPSRPFVLPLSAQTPDALIATARDFADFLDSPDVASIDDVVYTASVRHSHLEQRLAIVAEDVAGVQSRLAGFLAGDMLPGVVSGAAPPDQSGEHRPKVAFIFPGQGSQWLGMGRELLEHEPRFAQVLADCEAAMAPYVDWSLRAQLLAEPSDELERIDVIQPVLLAIEIALAELWRAWGVEPDAVIGHSMGEIASAYIGGAIDLDDAMRIICRRSQLMARTSGEGGMAMVELTIAEAEARLEGRQDVLSIAVSNSPRSTVIAGDTDALHQLLAELEADGVFCRAIKVDVASHSPQMDPLQPELRDHLADVAPRAGGIPIYSTSRADVSDGADMGAGYWVDNLRHPVQFGEMVRRLIADGTTVFIEMSPHPILLPAVRQCTTDDAEVFTVASLRRDEPEQATMLASLGQLFADGYPVDWSIRHRHGNVVSLPTYPWQRELHWYEPAAPTVRRTQIDHPLWDDAQITATGLHVWDGLLDLDRFPFLADHRVGDTAVFPAAGFIEMTLTAAGAVLAELSPGSGNPALSDVVLHEVLPLLPGRQREIQLIMIQDVPGRMAVEFFSRDTHRGDGDEHAWTRHLSAVAHASTSTSVAGTQPLTDGPAVPGSELYEAAAARGLPYGPTFQGVHQFWRTERGVLAELSAPDIAGADHFLVPPNVIDSAFQLLLATLPDGDEAYLPVGLGQVQVVSTDQANGPYSAAVEYRVVDDGVLGDVELFVNGNLRVAVTDLRLEPLPQPAIDVDDFMYAVEWRAQPASDPSAPPAEPSHWLILAPPNSIGDDLAATLRTRGDRVDVIGAEQIDDEGAGQFEEFVASLRSETAFIGIVNLWGVESGESSSGSAATRTIELIQTLSAAPETNRFRMWLVTRDAVAVDSDVDGLFGAQLWGLGRVIDHEHPELNCTRIDLCDSTMSADDLLAEILIDGAEREVALRPAGRFVPRLVPCAPEFADAATVRPKPAPGRPFRVVVTEPGILDNLHPQPLVRESPGPGQIEIEVKVSGLNFLNVMSALGVYPGYERGVGPLGIECSGVVVAVGDGVSHLVVGDEVMGMGLDTLGSHTLGAADLFVHKPSTISFAEAATVPVAFLTASYALHRLGGMRTGERILIHSGAGGVGHAAIQLAKRVGAEIFATAGTDERRAYLRTLGVDHVMDSRSLAFADEIRLTTDGEGVDIVLNSLAGEAIAKGLETLRPYGRFLEIGKRDIYDNNRIGLAPFKENLSYFAIDLERMSRERPDLLRETLEEVCELLEAGEISPLPFEEFPVAEVGEAFRHMAQAKHLGKVVIVQHFEASDDAAPRSADPTRRSYLITGGTGALGMLTARWLAENEPCDLVLVARRPVDDATRASIAELEALGSTVMTRTADVTDMDALAAVVAEIDDTLSPLCGVVHAAGVLADSMVMSMDSSRFVEALAPKVNGAWNLHELTKDRNLDVFVLFSSATSVLGTPGQGNYAAGNAFLDALAHHRRARGLAALSINWGPWADVGLAAAESTRGRRLGQRGLGSMAPSDGIEALSRLWQSDAAQAVVMAFDLPQWTAAYPVAGQTPMYAELAGAVGETAVRDSASDFIAQLRDQPNGRQQLLTEHVRVQVAQVLRMAADRVATNRPLKALGIDSLMALELRNRLETTLGLTLSATLIWNYPTINALAGFLVVRLGLDTPDGETDGDPKQRVIDGSGDGETDGTEALDGMSDDEIEALLSDELAEIDELLEEL